MSSDLINLAQIVLSHYDVKPLSIRIIQSGGIKVVWKVTASDGDYCLKRLRQEQDKALFTIQAQHYMASKGAKVPAIILTKSGELYVIFNSELFVLYQWVNGENLYFSRTSDLEQSIYGIAQFHRDSAGYVPTLPCEISTKLGRWPHYYQSVLARLREWKMVSLAAPTDGMAQAFLKYVDDYIATGETALALLEKSAYRQWVEEIEERKCLCHQDYGDGNALLTREGVCVLDMDGVTYDLPARDLRKLINKRAWTGARWNTDLMESIIQWYCKENPLTPAQIQVLYIDLLFPHEFHDTAKNPFKKNKPTGAGKIAQAAKHEMEKKVCLEELLKPLT